MKYRPITYDLLKEKNACQEQLDLFEKGIGLNEPIPLNAETIEKFGSSFDIEWAAVTLLNEIDLIEFYNSKVTRLAHINFCNKHDLAWNEYKNVKAKAMHEFSTINGIKFFEYEKVKDAARSTYDKVADAALAECKKAQANEFVRIYKRGLTS